MLELTRMIPRTRIEMARGRASPPSGIPPIAEAPTRDQAMPIETQERRVYLISPWRRRVFWPIIIGTLVVLESVVLVEPTKNALVAGLILFAFFMLCGLGLERWLSRVRLVLSPAGPKLIQIGYILETDWPNVVGVRLDRGREGLITRAPLEGKGAARIASLREMSIQGMPMYDARQQALLGERRLIPIEPFGWYLRRGPLMEDITRFAPHLEADRPAGPRPAPPIAPR
jgi:hypothetical protein